jgi:hypothetical protein
LVVFDEACHDDKTEVMTDDGWKLFCDISPDDRLLTMDSKTHASYYTHPSRLIAKPYKGKMCLYEAKGMNFCVTPDHDMYFRGLKSHNPWKKGQIKDLNGNTTRYFKKSIKWKHLSPTYYPIVQHQSKRKYFEEIITPRGEWFEFLGWYMSEGHIVWKNGVAVGCGITQYDESVLSEIHELCLSLGFPAKKYKKCVKIHSVQIGSHLATYGHNCLQKYIPYYVRHSSKENIEIFLNAFCRGDGYQKGKGRILYTSSKKMADGLQEMILKLGRPSVVRKRLLEGRKADFGDHIATSSTDGYVITWPYKNTNAKYYKEKRKYIDYNGTVYCATVDGGLLLTRRNGYTLWSGNCGIIRPIWKAALEGLMIDSRCRFLAIGNPTDPTGYFYKICQPDSGWNVIGISVKDTPNYKENREVIPGVAGRAYYDRMKAEYGEDSNTFKVRVLGEFPTYLEGTFYGDRIAAIQRNDPSGIGDYPWEENVPVYTFGDYGDIHTAIIFVQFIQETIRVIDFYYDNDGVGVSGYAKMMDTKPYVYASRQGHWAGWDLDPSTGSNRKRGGKTVKDSFAELGYDMSAVEKSAFNDGIEDVRGIFNKLRINERNCKDLVTALQKYRKKKNEQLSTDDKPAYHREPVKDWTNHVADAVRHLARAYRWHLYVDGMPLGVTKKFAPYYMQETEEAKDWCPISI